MEILKMTAIVGTFVVLLNVIHGLPPNPLMAYWYSLLISLFLTTYEKP